MTSADNGATRGRWFLPHSPDVLGRLREQARVTGEGMAAFAAWAAGESSRAQEVRDIEHDADDVRRTLVEELRSAFTTPLAAEDLFKLSQDLDAVMNAAKNTVREADVMQVQPDEALAAMALDLEKGVAFLCEAFEALGRKGEDPTEPAARAVKAQRDLERVYRNAMVALMEQTDLRTVISKQELYRRMSAAADSVVAVADRIWYSTVKES